MSEFIEGWQTDLGSDSVLVSELECGFSLGSHLSVAKCVCVWAMGDWVVQGLWQCVYGFDFSFDLICFGLGEGENSGPPINC